MQLLSLIGALSAVLSLSGEVAYINTGTGGVVSVVNLESGDVRQVGPGRSDGAPRWSPDGAWLCFETSTDSGRAIYVVRHDGTGGRVVGEPNSWNTSPAWSPDGTRIAYTSAPAAGALGQLHVHDLNTSETAIWGGGRTGLVMPQLLPYTLLLQALNPDAAPEIAGVEMAGLVAEARMSLEELKAHVLPEAAVAVILAPQGSAGKLAVSAEIALITPSYVLPLMALPDLAGEPKDALVWGVTANWSDARLVPNPGPDFGAYSMTKTGSTTRLAFESNEGADRELYVLGKRGIANVSNHRSADWKPVWSPDGKQLAFESFRGGRRGIWKVYVDTAHVTPIAAPENADCWSPAWSPDGSQVIYVSNETGSAELMVTSEDEGETQPVTAGSGSKEAPAWRPTLD